MADPVLLAEIATGPIDGAGLLARVGRPADGAAILFEGRVRETNGDREVRALHYEAYDEMGRQELAAILRETAGRFGVGRLGAIHRTGSLEIGEVSVAVAVAAPHRDQAFAASRHIMDEIKRRLPIWKKEEYRDGTSRWLGGETGLAPGGEDRGGAG